MVNTAEALGHWLRLSLTPGVGLETARKLLATWGDPGAIFEQSDLALRHIVSAKQAQALHQPPLGWAELSEATWQWLNTATDPGMARAVITLGDPDYPAALLEIPDPPLMLHALGQIQALRGLTLTQTVALVGSRNPTPQGRNNAQEFARSLAASGLTVVSGLAMGVDGAAHEGALQGGLQRQNGQQHLGNGPLATVAVVGTGLDRVYPKQHRDLAHQIALHGVLLSEYPLGTPPLAPNFPRRNRLISGLSQATLVVEAALQSGSLITAKQALEQGRDVMAIPGSIHSAQSKGCHLLIKQGAKLVESAQDVLEELRLPEWTTPDTTPNKTPLASPPLAHQKDRAGAGNGQARDERQDSEQGGDPETALLLAMGYDPVSLDALQARCGWPTGPLQAQLLEWELMGQVGRLPGGLFQRTGSA